MTLETCYRVLRYTGDPKWLEGTLKMRHVNRLYQCPKGEVQEILLDKARPFANAYVLELQLELQEARKRIKQLEERLGAT